MTVAEVSTGPSSHLDARLDQARNAVEKRFLQAGQVLADTVEGVGGLIQGLEALSQALDPATASATTAELKSSAASLLALPERHAQRRATVARMDTVSADLGGCIDDMRRDLGYLWVFAINIKISAAGVEAAGPEFGLFAQEICDRIKAGRDQLGGFDQALQALRDELGAALFGEQDLARQCEDLLPAVPNGLSASAEALAAQQAEVSRAAQTAAGLAQQIHRKVGGVLAALQVGDMTRQRIEHVQSALRMIDDGADAKALTSEARARLAAAAHRLLAAQLTAAGEDFQKDVGRIRQNMSGLASDADELLRLRDLAFGQADQGSEGFLRSMEGQVSQALDLVARMEEADGAAAQIGGSAATAAAALSSRIESLQAIKTDVQYMALNTTLKCSRFGDVGKPLAVIALELREHAGELDQSARTAVSALDVLAGTAGELDGAAGAIDASAGVALADAARRLREAGEDTTENLAALARQGAAVVDALKRASAGLDFQREIGATLDEAADALGHLAGYAAPDTKGLSEALGSLLARIAKTYTMARERETHRDVVEAMNLSVEEVAPAVLSQPPEDVLF